MLRVAVLVKQVPVLEELALGRDGRLLREGLHLELNAYCRRAVAKGVELASRAGGECVAITLGPATAADALREAIAWGADRGVLVSDPAFAGSDTLATARALAAVIRREGPFDLIFAGRNSVDADTGHVGPQLAELLDLPFAGPVRELAMDGAAIRARCERDDGVADVELMTPAVLSAAERLCAPAKRTPAERAAVPAEAIRTLTAADLGPGPWGQAGSPTRVGGARAVAADRPGRMFDGPLAEQVRAAVDALLASGALAGTTAAPEPVPPPTAATPTAATQSAVTPTAITPTASRIAVLGEPGRLRTTRELLGAAARLGGPVVLITPSAPDAAAAWSWGADEMVELGGARAAEDVRIDDVHRFWAVLAPSTPWGREAAARLAARHGAGLIGDAVEVDRADGRLRCWKPAFGGRLLAAVTADGPTQLATVRPGALPLPAPRAGGLSAPVAQRQVQPRGRVIARESVIDDDPDALALARVVVGVGQALEPADYPDLKPLLDVLGAELGATRKVTDRGWLPRSRQIGVTGYSVAPALYVALAIHGKQTHMAGVRRAGFVLAINADPTAPVFAAADAGIVGEWRAAAQLLARELAARL